jgi:hypothetical protein
MAFKQSQNNIDCVPATSAGHAKLLFHLNRPLYSLIHAVQETPRRWVGAVVPDFVVTAPLEVDEIRTDAGVFQGLLQQAAGLYAYIVGADC